MNPKQAHFCHFIAITLFLWSGFLGISGLSLANAPSSSHSVALTPERGLVELGSGWQVFEKRPDASQQIPQRALLRPKKPDFALAFNQHPDEPIAIVLQTEINLQADQRKNLQLWLPDPLGAIKVWVNGDLLLEDGETVDQHRQIRRGDAWIDLPKANVYDITILINNSAYPPRATGLYLFPRIGYSPDILQLHERHIGIDMFMIGLFFITGLYHIFLFILRPQDKSPLVLAGFVFATAMRILIAGDGRLLTNSGMVSAMFSYSLENASTCLVGFCYSALIILVLKPERLGRLSFGAPWLYAPMLISGMATLTSFIPIPGIIEGSLMALQVSVLLIGVPLVPWLSLAVIRRQPQSQLIALGYLSPVIFSIADIIAYRLGWESLKLGPVGIAIFVGCQAMMLSIRFNNLYLDVEHSKENLEAEVKTRNHLLKELSKLVYRHQITSIREGAHLESTMPVTSRFTCVLCFDIQNSSQIKHPEKHTFFQVVLKRCHQLMMADYDPYLLTASAYMVKELGDGFLCSVGFPFVSEGNIYDKSLLLAERIIKLFQEHVRNYFSNNEEVYCSIGIACGEISGYFPRTGLKQYDLYGEAIIRATRYEAFRKVMFVTGKMDACDVILVQKDVYDGLSEEYKSHLKSYPLRGMSIRDDPDARTLYFKLVQPEHELDQGREPKVQAS